MNTEDQVNRLLVRNAELEAEIEMHKEFQASVAAIQPRIGEQPAKLDAAIEFIRKAPHGDNCFVSAHYEGDPGDRCNCGKDALLDWLESDDSPAASGAAVTAKEALEAVLKVGRGTSGRLILEKSDEDMVRRALLALAAPTEPPKDEREAFEKWWRERMEGHQFGAQITSWDAWQARASLAAATQQEPLKAVAPVVIDALRLALRRCPAEHEARITQALVDFNAALAASHPQAAQPQVWHCRDVEGNGPLKKVHSADEAQNMRAIGYTVSGPHATAQPQEAAQARELADMRAEAERLNPYKDSGITGENWRRGFLGEKLIAMPGSVAEQHYIEGKAARAAIKQEGAA